MVIGANSMPSVIPNLGCTEERNYLSANSSVLIYHGCENSTAHSLAVRRPWDQALLQLDSSALLGSGLLPSSLLQHKTSVFQL